MEYVKLGPHRPRRLAHLSRLHELRRGGLVTLTITGRSEARASRFHTAATALCHPRPPLRSEGPQRRPGDEVALKIECVVDGSVHVEEAHGAEPADLTAAFYARGRRTT